MSSTKFHAIIPARWQSSRFPGKPLADIRGKPMFWHVYNRTRQCGAISDVILATDDDRIRSAAQQLRVPVVMTRPDHPSGSDRVLEAARKLGVKDKAVVINVQGDEPLLEPRMLSELIEPFQSAAVRVTTLARAFDETEDRGPDRVKVVFSDTGRALYFSRSPIPFVRDAKTAAAHLHIGLYAFRMDTLKRFVTLPRGRLEQLEKLEQLRLLENDIPIHVVVTEHRSIGVDRPEDLAVIERLMDD